MEYSGADNYTTVSWSYRTIESNMSKDSKFNAHTDKTIACIVQR